MEAIETYEWTLYRLASILQEMSIEEIILTLYGTQI